MAPPNFPMGHFIFITRFLANLVFTKLILFLRGVLPFKRAHMNEKTATVKIAGTLFSKICNLLAPYLEYMSVVMFGVLYLVFQTKKLQLFINSSNL